jgi:hypothetical protein
MRKKEEKKMTLEVYKNGSAVGFVRAKNTLEAYKIVREFFPDCSNVRSGHLPISDVRCVKLNDNVYTWNLTK